MFITPNDAPYIGQTDSESIQNAIDAAETGPVRTVLIPRRCARTGRDEWSIDKTLLLPSNITVILDDCHLTLADGVYENIFRNKNMYADICLTDEGEQHDIRIVGQGDAVLDGGRDNGVREQLFRYKKCPPPRTGCLILLNNVRDYVLAGFKCVNMRYWAINQIACRHGYLHDISFFNGERHPNQDGINLRIGCSDIVVERISGRTGDDVVALSGFAKGGDAKFLPAGRDPDIHDVIVRDVTACTHCTLVALRCCDGAKLYNVTIENISDNGGEYEPWGIVRIGENNYYKQRPAVFGEIYDITVSGVHSLRRGTVYLSATLKDSRISRVHAGGAALYAVSTYLPEEVFWENDCVIKGGADMQNVLVSDVRYDAVAGDYNDPWLTDVAQPFGGCALDFRCMREGDRMDNVVFRDISAREGVPLYLGDRTPDIRN